MRFTNTLAHQQIHLQTQIYNQQIHSQTQRKQDIFPNTNTARNSGTENGEYQSEHHFNSKAVSPENDRVKSSSSPHQLKLYKIN